MCEPISFYIYYVVVICFYKSETLLNFLSFELGLGEGENLNPLKSQNIDNTNLIVTSF